MRSSREICSTS